MNLIRKISIGNDLKTAMHYQVGDKISDIIQVGEYFDVYKIDGDVKIKWKSFRSNIVSHIEYNTNE